MRPPPRPANKPEPSPAVIAVEPESKVEEFHFFWQGPLSQWHHSPFTVNGVRYTHAEQFMMAEKAKIFGDGFTLGLIMTATTPKKQKELVRGVANFNEAVWKRNARDVVMRGNRAKFTQNPEPFGVLMATAGKTLVEASPYDRVWGIGLAASDPRALSRKTWRGENGLGEVLTELRREFELSLEQSHGHILPEPRR